MKDKTFYTIINTCVVIALIIIAIIAISLICQVIPSTTNNDTHYIVQAEVIDVDTTSDTVQIEDTHGEIWEFFGTDNFQKGNSVIVLMDNQRTSAIYDDEILNVHLVPFAN